MSAVHLQTRPVAVEDPSAQLPTPQRAWLPMTMLAGLAAALMLLIMVSALSGQLPIAPAEVLGSILHRIGIDAGPLPASTYAEAALWSVRFPRVVLALVVGGSLAVGGVLMQGVFGNPLAEPGVIGVSSGAAVGACVVIVFGLATFGPWTLVIAAFIGGLLATLIAYRTARRGGRTEVVTLVLTGVAINAVCGALVALLFARRLDLLSLGERAAGHLGVDVERLRSRAIVLVAVLTSAAVAFGGIISFVGLVVPHLVRMVLGPGHRWLLMVSAFGGAVLLLAADLLARTLVTYAELPIGMLTALVGGPFFFWLIRRTSRGAGGWA